MNILILAGDVPATSEMPGSPRLFSLCRELSQRHRLLLLAQGPSEERWQWFMDNPEVGKVFAEVIRLPEPPPTTWLRLQHHRLRNASHLSTRYRNPGYHRQLHDLIAAEIAKKSPVDLVYVDGLTMTQYLDGRPRLPMIVDLHDCFSLLFRRRAQRERSWRGKLTTYLEALSIASWERSLAHRFGIIITNSTVDESALRRQMPDGGLVTITNGVDCDYFAPAENGQGSHRLVFTGVMDYGPNVDAARYCADEIFPRVREKVPDAEFWLVGADPCPEVQSLGTRDGIHVTGRVDDVRPYMQSAGVCICPMRYGAGIKNKILAAMAMRKPVVSTSLGLEGIDARPGRDVLLADGSVAFADQIVSVLTRRDLAERLGDNGYQLVRATYSWKAKAELLESTLQMRWPDLGVLA